MRGPVRRKPPSAGLLPRAFTESTSPRGFGWATLAWSCGADFAHGGAAGKLAGTPHVPACDGAVRAPAFAKGEEFFRFRHVLFAVGDGPAFFDAEVVDGENVGAAEAEDEKHFDGPGADAADGNEALDEFFVGELFGLFECGDNAVEGFLGEVFHGEDFCAGEAGFAQDGLSQLQHFLRSGGAAGSAECFDAAVDGGGGFTGDGLVGDGFDQGFVRRLGGFNLELKRGGFFDQVLQVFIAFGEVLGGFCKVKRENGG